MTKEQLEKYAKRYFKEGSLRKNGVVSGISLPQSCLRCRTDCQPLAQIAGDASFICAGHNTPESRTVPGDRFRLCWQNDSVDEISDWDERDFIDTSSVILQALSADANMRVNAEGGAS